MQGEPARSQALGATVAAHLMGVAPKQALAGAGELSVVGGSVANMVDLIAEASQMPDAAVRFARGVSQVWTPEHLVPLRTTVRTRHSGQLGAVHAALDERFNDRNANWMGVFRAAAEMAVMEQVGHRELKPEDRTLLRQLWTALLNAT